MVHCGACIHYFSMFSLFPSSLHTQFIQKLVQYQTDSHASVPFWFSSILSSFGETKNAYFRPQETLEWRNNEIQHFDNETRGEEEDDVHLRRDDSRYFLLFEAAFESAASVYYPVISHGCSSGIGDDFSNNFPACVFS